MAYQPNQNDPYAPAFSDGETRVVGRVRNQRQAEQDAPRAPPAAAKVAMCALAIALAPGAGDGWTNSTINQAGTTAALKTTQTRLPPAAPTGMRVDATPRPNSERRARLSTAGSGAAMFSALAAARPCGWSARPTRPRTTRQGSNGGGRPALIGARSGPIGLLGFIMRLAEHLVQLPPGAVGISTIPPRSRGARKPPALAPANRRVRRTPSR